jgi:RNA polymerase sigma-70 factor (ECF subfamily)
VFDVGYHGIAAVLDRSEAACRQVVHRARERVRGDRKRFEATESEKAEMLQRFMTALDARDEAALLQLFAPDAIWTADGGGKTAAGLHPIVGADRLARLGVGLREKFWGPDRTMRIATINGENGICILDGDRLIAVLSIATDGDRILEVYAIVNPDKLH